MKKTISVILALLLFFNFTIVNAKIQDTTDSKLKAEDELIRKIHILSQNHSGRISIEQLTEEESELLSVVGVAIFVDGILVGYLVDGILVGYLVDGIITYVSGQSAGAWVSEVLSWVFSDGRITKIYVDSNDRVIRAEDNQRCYKSSYSGRWYCQVGAEW